MRKFILFLGLLFTLTCTVAFGNKTGVEVNAPEEAEKGTEITITINVTHSGNSKLHHTDRVWLKINGEEVKRWEYDGSNMPPDAVFTLEYKYKIGEELSDTEELTVEAEGNCNIHGTAGISKVTVKVL
ncbi:MAG: hypothetical protein JXB19_00160 [Bacteroidales bacterium]|nr:hypothetical protein [Bacteroidales bacterium]